MINAERFQFFAKIFFHKNGEFRCKQINEIFALRLWLAAMACVLPESLQSYVRTRCVACIYGWLSLSAANVDVKRQTIIIIANGISLHSNGATKTFHLKDDIECKMHSECELSVCCISAASAIDEPKTTETNKNSIVVVIMQCVLVLFTRWRVNPVCIVIRSAAKNTTTWTSFCACALCVLSVRGTAASKRNQLHWILFVFIIDSIRLVVFARASACIASNAVDVHWKSLISLFMAHAAIAARLATKTTTRQRHTDHTKLR